MPCSPQVEGRVLQTATSPTGSRVLQACIKHSTAEQRSQLLRQLLPHILDLSKQPYGHFLVRRLIALASKEDQKGMKLKMRLHCGNREGNLVSDMVARGILSIHSDILPLKAGFKHRDLTDRVIA